MSRSITLLVLTLAALTSLPVSAIDLFTFDGPQDAKRQASTIKSSSFKAKMNPAAMAQTQESVVVNLPHKRIPAKRLDDVGDITERITPYAFEGQKGSVIINSSNGKFESVVVFDQLSKEVFKGNMQADGSILFKEVDIDTYICDDFDRHDISGSTELQAADVSYYQNLNGLTFSQVTSLQSRPGASKVLYIDYLAGSVSGTDWNVGEGAPQTIVYDNYSYDNDPSTFSLIDLQSMYAGWAEAAEDYAPFDVNVTTDLSVYNATAHINKSKIIATSTNWRGSGGVAYVNVFGLRNDDYYSIGWTFNESFGSLGMTNSHEAGHQMGLRHDGTSSREYYGGAGNSGPIMGGPFGKDFVHWNNGSYPGANRTENDLTIIQGKLGLVADDHGNSNGTSSVINAQETVGFISPEGIAADVDVFNFTLPATQNVDLTVRSLFEQFNNNFGDNTAGGLNLSAKIELRDASNTLISQKLPSSVAANNGFSYSGSLAAGTYYLSIRNQAYAGANFNEYGNGGYYQILYSASSSPGPDMVIDSPAVNDSTLSPNQPFNFWASVKNQGSSASAATTLRYYRSNDATISSADVALGTDSVSSLAVNGSETQNIDLTAPNSSGDYYYGACVDSVGDESNTSNNCSDGVLVSVSPPASSDLIVIAPSVSSNSLNAGQSFTLFATVSNQGNGTANASTLTYYRSTNSTISTSDTSIGTDAVVSLGSNSTSPESINLNAPSMAGTYYYGACVSSASGESNTTNNCSGSTALTVKPPILADGYEPDNNSVDAKTINDEAAQEHNFHVTGDQDWLQFTLSDSAKDIVIETSGSDGDDTELTLYDSELSVLNYDDDGGQNTYSKITMASLAAGTYFIRVNEYNNDNVIEAYNVSLGFSLISEEDDQPLCVPVKTTNGKLTLICL